MRKLSKTARRLSRLIYAGTGLALALAQLKSMDIDVIGNILRYISIAINSISGLTR